LKYLDLPLELSHKSRLHVLLQKEMIKDIHIFPSEAFDGKWVQHFAASITLQNNPNYASWRRNRDQIFRKLHIRKKIAKRLGTL
jgi:hypothetical protein